MSGHHHHDHGHCHEEGHDHEDDITPALQSLLHSQIQFENVTTMNESVSRAGAAILQKHWTERLNEEPELESDADEQLLMHIPFTGQVKLHSILIYTAPTPSAPKTLKLYKNRNDIDFSLASDLDPTQKLEIPQPVAGTDVFEIPLNRASWNTTTSITLFFEDNWGDEDTTKIGYLGFKGQFMALNREPVSVMYEAAANPSDHVAIQGVSGLGGKIMPGQ